MNRYPEAPLTPARLPARALRGATAWLCVLALALAVALALTPAPARAQLPVDGYLGPDPVEEDIEDEVEEQVEEVVEETVEDAVEEEVADVVEDQVEQVTEQNIQENIEEDIEETIEQSVDDTVEESIEETVAETVEESVEEEVAATVEESVQASVEESVEETVEEEVAATVEESVEASVEESVEESVEATVEESVEESVAETVEESVEESVAATVEESVEESVAASVEDDVEAGVEDAVESAVEEDVEAQVVAAIEERLETEIDEIVEDLESHLEVNEDRILKEQWLVMAEPAVFEELDEQGYLFDTVTELPGLGLRLAEVAAPSSFDITEVRQGVLDVVGKDRAEVDLNHIYTAGAPLVAEGDGVLPRTAMPPPADLDNLSLRVGMIDSDVDVTHPALARSSISTRSFARPGAKMPADHGTAIASIIAGNADDYMGLAPKAEVYAASVFELDRDQGEIASTVSLIRAVDWLMSSGVDVINISLAGPPNRLLEAALERAAGEDVVIMAAAGNGGPVARPMYPAAYGSVVAVTAVDAGQRVFRLANRGDYLALAAPGVDLRHARPGGGYAASSGTSFAVPFAVTAAARLRQLQPAENIVDLLYRSALDLGPPGRDDIYGYGLLTLAAN